MSVPFPLGALLLPPLGLAVAALALCLLAARGRRAAAGGAALLLVLQLLLATPFAATWLEFSLQSIAARFARPRAAPETIIVLGAEQVRLAEGWTVGPLTLERMAGAAALARQTGLPILVSGGTLSLSPPSPPLAGQMAQRFETDFGLVVRWLDNEARNTWENARNSAAILRAEGIGSVYVVTHGWHMPRALLSFRAAGLSATPAPVRSIARPRTDLAAFLPSADRWGTSWLALREWTGLAVYAIRLRLSRP
ncbi:MAG: YdcF family protein [Elioraea sp.]|nr:YdcF family protein [Elioraea sp.]